jgi:hypothetical protein
MSVVVLTRDFVYWGERPLRDALRLIVKGKVEIVAADESKFIHAGISREGITFKMPAPLVIRLLEFVGIKVRHEEIAYSKEAVFARDNYICGYWHKKDGKKFKYKCTSEDITLDHIIPKSRGGDKKSFLNSVTACKNCNINIKRGKTPKEAGLELIKAPFIPKRKKGDMVIVKFYFNPENPAHKVFRELFNVC